MSNLTYSIKGGEGQSNTTVVMLNILCDIRATCFDSTESSSGTRVLDPYKQCTTHCEITNAYNKREKITETSKQYRIRTMWK